MTSRGEMLNPVLPQAESTLDSTKLTIASLSKRKKNSPVFFLFAIPIVYAKLFKQINKNKSKTSIPFFCTHVICYLKVTLNPNRFE